MFRYIFGILLGIRNVFQSIAIKLINKLRDPKTGKFIGVNPKTLSMLLWTTGLVFFFIVITSRILTKEPTYNSGEDAFNKEMTPKLGINLLPPEFSIKAENDLEKEIREMSVSGTESEQQQEVVNSQPSSSSKEEEKPSKEDCDSLLAKMQLSEELSSLEKAKMNSCLKDNVSGLSPEQLQFAQALMADDLSDDEKIILRKALSGEATNEELALAKALSGKDENVKRLAKEAVGDPELREAFAKQLLGKPLSEEERELLAGKLGEDSFDKIKLSTEKTSSDGDFGKVDGFNSEQLTKLAEAAKNQAEKVAKLDAELAEAQAEASEAGGKISRGEVLSDKEQAAISRLSEAQKSLSKEKTILQKQKEFLAEKSKLIQSTLSEVASKIEEAIPSGILEEYEEDELKMSSLPEEKRKSISPDKMKLFSIKKKKQIEFALKKEVEKIQSKIEKEEMEEKSKISEAKDIRSNVNNSLLGGAEPLDVSGSAQNGQVASIDQSVIFANKALKAFNLTPDMKIPAVLMTPILISDKGKAQIIKVKILSDVFEPESNRLVIPKGSIAVGTTQGFDADTGIMDLAFDKVSLGSGKIVAMNFSVGSADGTFGLKGEVRDTRGKLLLGAFVSSFSAGALSWFSNTVVQPFLTSTTGTDALLGAGLGGAAEVANRIAEMYSGDLQNSAKIFYAPKVPVVLFPQ